MSTDFISKFISSTQEGVVKSVQKLIEDEHIEEDIANEAQQYAQMIANHEHDPSQPLPKPHKGISLDKSEEDKLAYLLVLDYLESLGLKFAPSVLRYESRHPSLFVERDQIAQQCSLRSYDRTPLLVQMIEETRIYHENHPEEEELE